ncbi:MAG: hypothetical protein ACR2HH_09795 [Chthoniobacterales bacterium]
MKINTSILAKGSALLLDWLSAPARADILYVSNAGNNTIDWLTRATSARSLPSG